MRVPMFLEDFDSSGLHELTTDEYGHIRNRGGPKGRAHEELSWWRRTKKGLRDELREELDVD